MSLYDPERDVVRLAGWWLRWAVVPAIVGVFISANVDARALPLLGPERESAVLLLDGQAYFGHLDDSGETGTLLLRDAYYFQDAKGGPTNLAVSLVKRGGEAHQPADGMRINRDRVLAVERIRTDSAVAHAIAVERAIDGVAAPVISLNRPAEAGAGDLATQRVAAEHAIARGYEASLKDLGRLNDLVPAVSRAQAQVIIDKAIVDLRTVRLSALSALGQALGMRLVDAEAYARATEPQLEGQSFVNEPGVLLAPNLSAVVIRASAVYTQVGDAAAKQLSQPTATPTPTPRP
jgi:hypothetical protein